MHPYGKHCDVFLEQRHQFLRKLQSPASIEGPYTAEYEPSRTERYVGAALVGAAFFVFIMWMAGAI